MKKLLVLAAMVSIFGISTASAQDHDGYWDDGHHWHERHHRHHHRYYRHHHPVHAVIIVH